MANTPPIREKKHTSLVAQAAAGERTPTTSTDPEWRHWNIRLPADLVERVWGTCEALGDSEDLPSAIAFTVRAFESYLDQLDDKHHAGQPYHADASPFRNASRRTYKR